MSGLNDEQNMVWCTPGTDSVRGCTCIIVISMCSPALLVRQNPGRTFGKSSNQIKYCFSIPPTMSYSQSFNIWDRHTFTVLKMTK